MKLPLRPFGSTGFQASPLALGTVKIGRNQKVKYTPFDLPSDGQVIELLETALDLGINLLDTAPAYGLAEERLGQLPTSLRERFLIFTKAGEFFRDGASHYDFSRPAIENSVHSSLKRLRRERLDAVLLHCGPDDLHAIHHTPAVEVLHEMKARGLIRAAGVSTMSLEGGMAALESADILMVAHNPWYTAEQPVIEAAARLGKGILIKKGLCSGNLPSGAPADPLETCIRSALSLPGQPALVAGTLNPAHLRHNTRLAAAIL